MLGDCTFARSHSSLLLFACKMHTPIHSSNWINCIAQLHCTYCTSVPAYSSYSWTDGIMLSLWLPETLNLSEISVVLRLCMLDLMRWVTDLSRHGRCATAVALAGWLTIINSSSSALVMSMLFPEPEHTMQKNLLQIMNKSWTYIHRSCTQIIFIRAWHNMLGWISVKFCSVLSSAFSSNTEEVWILAARAGC